MKCYKYGDKRRTQQKFNKDICFVKYGKPIKIYDFIQESANEVDIYKNLEKYGSIQNAALIMSRKRPMIIADFEECMDLRSLEDKRIAIENIWNQLPTEEKDKFSNNIANFMDNGYEHYTNELKRINEEIKKAKEINKPKKEEGGQNNGTEK